MFTTPEGEVKNGISKVRYSHDAMIDMIIANPSVKQTELAKIFDRSDYWVSMIVSSDAFQARLAERKSELVDPEIVASIRDRISAVANASLTRIMEKLSGPLGNLQSDDFLLKSAKLATDALGYGARVPTQTTNVAVVVQVPSKIASATEWAATYSQPTLGA